jgi:hypothetical protein
MRRQFRRVVTGHSADGRSKFIMDGPAPTVFDRGQGQTCVTEFWETAATPADNRGDADPSLRGPRLPPPPNGSVFRIVEYPPDRVRIPTLRGDSHDATHEGYTRDLKNVRHPGFHKTASLDYAIVVSGEIYALMDEGEVLLRAGDVLIQRGTNHAWSNRTDQPAYIAFVLIDAKPV